MSAAVECGGSAVVGVWFSETRTRFKIVTPPAALFPHNAQQRERERVSLSLSYFLFLHFISLHTSRERDENNNVPDLSRLSTHTGESTLCIIFYLLASVL